jgi:PAS domain S-box-containing protein
VLALSLTPAVLCAGEASGIIRLQLKWHHQFQFAGYYAAQQQGYYAEAGLNVEIIEGSAAHPAIPAVVEGSADFGVSDADVLLARLRGKPLVVCAAVFQHSPYVILSRADRGIRAPADLIGTRTMLGDDQGAAQFRAMLSLEGIDPGKVNLLPHSWNLDDLVSGRVDAMSAYATVEPAQLRALGVEPAVTSMLDYGVDFYGDTLFTTQNQIDRHPGRTEAFVRASLRGWVYAMNHPAGIADYILTLPGVSARGVTREILLGEAAAMRPLILPDVIEIGHMNPGRWQNIANTFAGQGMVSVPANSLDSFLYDPNPPANPELMRWIVRLGLVLVACTGLVLLWILQMRRSVRTRTRELRDEITRREEAERELRQSELGQRELALHLETERARLAEAQVVAKIGSWETDLLTFAVRWSEETHRIFETDPLCFEASHQAFLDRIHPEDRADVDAAFVQSFGRRESCVIDHRILLPGGRVKYVEERWVVFTDVDGRPVRAAGTCQDITVRRESEAHLRLLENSISRISDIIIITKAELLDAPGPEIVFVNDAFERVTGYTRAEALGKSPRMFQGPKTSRATLDRIRASITAGRSVHEELYNYGKDGREYWLDVNISPVTDRAGRITHLVAVERDITERKKLEEQFFRAQRMESIGTLAGGIAHDLNNLLSPIIMGVDLIRQFEVREETRMVLQNIHRSAKRGAELVRQVLSFARGVEGARVSVQLDHIVQEIEGIVANTFPKNILFERKIPADLWLVVGDPTQLNQVLLNLCVNARDAMPKGGRLTVSGMNAEIDAQYAVLNRGVVAGRYVVLEVADTGVGMTKEVADRIFEPFFTTKAVGEGTGLGLSTVLGIVRSHGGFVNVYSEPNHGSVFKVYLPAQESDQASVERVAGYASMPRGHGELILIVDDESSIRTITKQTLESFGYRAITADDGAQAIGIYAQRRAEISVVLTDMMMPIMDGSALISAIRRMDKNVPIIAASGLNSKGSMARVSAAGVDHFLSKPYNIETLLVMLKNVTVPDSPN